MMNVRGMSSIFLEYGERLETILYRMVREAFEKSQESGVSFGKRVFGGTHTESSSQSKASRWFKGKQKLRVAEFYMVAKELDLIPDRIFAAAINELENCYPKKTQGQGHAEKVAV